MQLTDPAVADYLEERLDPHDEILDEMEAYARETKFPIVGRQMGRLMALLAQAAKVRTVFEMGSGYGYSALWFARALPEKGKIICSEGDPDNVERARQYLDRADVIHKAQLRVGDAIEILAGSSGPFDLIFIDIGKKDYPRARSGWRFQDEASSLIFSRQRHPGRPHPGPAEPKPDARGIRGSRA
ncbi:class I SAM-dependent methyltransferase [bacterium]|nr:class I SAM-dependent methyltransferase [bacterium]